MTQRGGKREGAGRPKKELNGLKRCPFCGTPMLFNQFYTDAVEHPRNDCLIFDLMGYGVDMETWNKPRYN